MYDPSSLHEGDIILVAGWGSSPGGDLLSLLISWATVNPFHHAAIVGDGKIIEALWTVQTSPLDKYASAGWTFSVDTSDAVRRAAVDWCMRRLGERYGIRELLDDAGRDVLHLPIGWRVRPRLYTCSGLIAAAYAAAGLVLTYAPLPSPADLSYSPLLVGTRPW